MEDIPTRIAVLEQIARSTEQALHVMSTDLRGLRDESREALREMRKIQHSDFRFLITIWISGVAVLLATMAHGFKWL